MDEKNNSSDAGASPLVAGHTPGPWAVSSEEALKIKDANGDSITMLYWTHLRGRRLSEEVAANARLIAAAPDLLAALKKMHAAFNAPKPIPKAEGDALESMCLSAITAAEGGSHSPNSPAVLASKGA